MSKLIELEWDSRIFGVKTGGVNDYKQIPDEQDLSAYKYVHVRIPQEDTKFVWQYQKMGFRYITLDFSLEKIPSRSDFLISEENKFLFIRKQQPTFKISGFKLLSSRLVIDPELSRYLSDDFWDKMIQNHCCNFADFALCRVDSNNRLVGFISFFEQSDAIDMFLVVVHPEVRHRGVGKSLMEAAEARALAEKRKLTTSVISNNIEAMNFYFKTLLSQRLTDDFS